MSTFALNARRWAERQKGDANEWVRRVVFKLSEKVIYRSPVGQPELWAINAGRAAHNKAIADFNAELRADPKNLTKAGRLRPGLKRKDTKKIIKPAGYVGGHFRRNWHYSIDAATGTRELKGRDKEGGRALGEVTAAVPAQVLGHRHFIQNNLPYARRLENGWSKQAPIGMVAITLVEFQSISDEALAEARDRMSSVGVA